MRINGAERCAGCMRPLETEGACPHCGFIQKEYHPIPRCLRPGSRLADRYVLGRVLGEGSFGISYVAWDGLLDTVVAIKEYFPASLVSRHVGESDDRNVYIYETSEKDKYQENLNKYLNEAKSLSRFSDLQGIVSVRDFFYENNTAYIVMGYVDGVSIKEYVEEHGPIEGTLFLEMLKPVISSLRKVHGMGVLHRDISPDNILVTRDNTLVLIDFGAARRENINMTRSMTVVFKRGFSPEEQYRSRGRQGTWTDVYALCATAYYALTGKAPEEAIQRVLEDTTVSLTEMPEVALSAEQKKTLMKGIAVNFRQRCQTMEELYQGLYLEKHDTRLSEWLWHSSRIRTAVGVMTAALLLVGVGILGNQTGVGHGEDAAPVRTAAVSGRETGTPLPASLVMGSCVGKTRAQVRKILKTQGDRKLKIQWKYRYSDSVKKGCVIQQSIPAGKTYQEGAYSSVTITVSKGKRKVSVPKLIGKDKAAAQKLLQKKKLKAAFRWQNGNSTKGTVMAQSITAGKKVTKNTVVTLALSKGIPTETVQTSAPAPTAAPAKSSRRTSQKETFEGVIP